MTTTTLRTFATTLVSVLWWPAPARSHVLTLDRLGHYVAEKEQPASKDVRKAVDIVRGWTVLLDTGVIAW